MARTVSLAACQFAVRPIGTFEDFATRVRSLLDRAEDADLVLFPELFTIELFTTLPEWRSRPVSELGRITSFTEPYRELFEAEAKSRDQVILAGSHLIEEDGGVLNAAHLFLPDGTVHVHRKTHIFPAEGDWGTREGDEMETIRLPFANVGVNICYEAEIPECSAALTEQGAEIVLCPSFTFTQAGFWRVRNTAAARCIENQIYFVHCCTGGQPGDPLPQGWARSSILSPCDAPWRPDGVVAEADPNLETVIIGEVDLDALHENRKSGAATTYRDRRRRSELYERWPSHMRQPAGAHA